jgi:hypothetical protein
MKKYFLEIGLSVVAIFLLLIGTKFFSFENITITTLGLLVGRNIATDVWNFKK